MKKANLIFGMIAMLAASSAYADGWQCQTVERDLNVAVYNHTQPSQGTRNAAIMIVADPAVQAGRKTVATFTDIEQTLSSQGSTYTAFASQAVNQGARGGEYLSGTRLMYVRALQLQVAFNYAVPTAARALVPGRLLVEKINGERLVRNMVCARYLKN
jgi:hypothetical protein